MKYLIFLLAFVFSILTFAFNAKNVLAQMTDNSPAADSNGNINRTANALGNYNYGAGQLPATSGVAPSSWPDFGTSQIIRNTSPNYINSVGNGPVNSVDHP